MPPRTLRRYAFFALIAMMINVLAPTLSYAAAAERGEKVVEMCTSFGIQKIAVPGDDGGTSPHFKHCPFCLGAGSVPPATVGQSTPLPLPPAPSSLQFVPAEQPGYNPFLSWAGIRKRGPPSFS